MILKLSKITLLVAVFALASACFAQVPTETDFVGGLKSKVKVRRDARSIPYIEADNLEDLYFAQGYETARDRLWQMDLMRRLARGRLAELFGKQVLAEDKRWRTFGFSEIAERSVENLSPRLRGALENYAKGVNAYIGSLEEKDLPVEFQILKYKPEPWKPTDTIVVGKILADSLSTTWWKDINRLEQQKLAPAKLKSITNVITPEDVVLFGKDSGRPSTVAAAAQISKDLEGIHDYVLEAKAIRRRSLERVGVFAENLAASNNWVISGKRTIDGKAILANDPHLRPSAPGIWYLSHLTAPGLRVSGVTFPGVPGVVLGHNDKIAWGATNVGPDVQDIYIEEFNDKNEYRTPDGWKKAVVRKETIRFRPNPILPKTETEEIEVFETRNGVVFRELNGKKVSLKWTALDPRNQEFEAFILLNFAGDWNQFRAALGEYGGAAQNFVYADTKGNIGWQVAGTIPIRKKGDGAFPYQGSSSDGDWIGTIPLKELPMLYNPPSGFIVTANQRIAGTDYKYSQVTRQIAGPWRARRIYDLIQANPKISVNDVRDIQHDVFNIPLSVFVYELVKRKAAPEAVLSVLRGWDGKMTADSKAAALANSINGCVGNETAKTNNAVNGWHLRQFILPFAIPADDTLWLPDKYNKWDELMFECAKRQSPANKVWGETNKAAFRHPLASVPLIGARFKVEFDNVNGSGQTPNVGASVSMRFIAKPSNWDQTRHVIPLGQSGATDSPHWKDQFESWRTGAPSVFPFSKQAVKAASKSIVVLSPENRN